MSKEQIVESMERAIAAFNTPEKRTDFFDLFDAPSMVIPCLPANLPPTFEGLKMQYRKLWSAFPDAELAIRDLIVDGDKLAFRYTLSGTHRGEFLGIEATGKHVNFDGVTILEFNGAKCIGYWNLVDTYSLLRQLEAA